VRRVYLATLWFRDLVDPRAALANHPPAFPL